MQSFEIPVGLMKNALDTMLTVNKRKFANEKKMLLPRVAEAIQNDLEQLQIIADNVRAMGSFDDILIVSRKNEIVKGKSAT